MEKNKQAANSFFHTKRLYRLWYYFRTGLTYYIGLPISAFNMAFLIYLMIVSIIPNFSKYASSFVTLMVVIIIILGVFFGILHFKKSRAYSSEMDVLYLNNPWVYKAIPGLNREIIIPYFIYTLKGMKRLSNKLSDLTHEESELINFLLDKGTDLMDGGLVKEPFIKNKRKILMEKYEHL